MELNAGTLERLMPSILLVWNSIGSDVEALYENKMPPNEEAIEMCIDASRLEEFANDSQADDIIVSLCKQHGYDKVLSFLSKNILIGF